MRELVGLVINPVDPGPIGFGDPLPVADAVQSIGKAGDRRAGPRDVHQPGELIGIVPGVGGAHAVGQAFSRDAVGIVVGPGGALNVRVHEEGPPAGAVVSRGKAAAIRVDPRGPLAGGIVAVGDDLAGRVHHFAYSSVIIVTGGSPPGQVLKRDSLAGGIIPEGNPRSIGIAASGQAVGIVEDVGGAVPAPVDAQRLSAGGVVAQGGPPI